MVMSWDSESWRRNARGYEGVHRLDEGDPARSRTVLDNANAVRSTKRCPAEGCVRGVECAEARECVDT